MLRLPSEVEDVGLSKSGEWSGLLDPKTREDGESRHPGQLDQDSASHEDGKTEAADATPTWMKILQTAVIDEHGQHNPLANNPQAASKDIKHGVIRDFEYFVPHLQGPLSALAAHDRAVIDKHIESILQGAFLFAQLDPLANHAYNDPKGWLQISSSNVQPDGLDQIFQSTIQARTPDSELVGVGHGANALDATRAAWLDLLVSGRQAVWLHRVRILDPNLTEADLCDEKHSKYDIFDIYTSAAARGSIPTVELTSVTLYNPRNGKLAPRHKFIIEATGLGISAHAVARSAFAAKNMAENIFMDKIKALDETQPASPDDGLLSIVGTPENAEHFIKTFLKAQRSQRHGLYFPVDVTITTWHPLGETDELRAAQVLCNRLPVGPVVMHSGGLVKLKALASYATALSLAAETSTAAEEPKSAQPSQDMIPLLEMHLDSSSLQTMTIPRSTRSLVVQRLPANVVEHNNGEEHGKGPVGGKRSWILPSARAKLNRSLAMRLEACKVDSRLEHIRAQRAELPIHRCRKRLLKLVKGSQFMIVTGAPGSGKTTQVPQILLDDAIERGCGAEVRILCLQPRRIAAVWVAQRVAAERGEPVGNSVGYQVRFDTRRDTQLGGTVNFWTNGIFLKKLESGVENILEKYSHIVIDEVHERSLELDLVLAVLKKSIAERLAKRKSAPKIILMSASVGDPKQFQEYFVDSIPRDQMGIPNAGDICPLLSVSGRTFPVSSSYIDRLIPMLRKKHGEQFDRLLQKEPGGKETAEYLDIELSSEWDIVDKFLAARHAAFVPIDLVAATIAHIASSGKPGAILVFLPGLRHILAVNNALRNPAGFLGVDFNDTSKFRIQFLHSTMPSLDQNEIFEKVPSGCRRVILSSNIAQTSVTVPDVVYVVDTGKTRAQRYDPSTRITSLATEWETQSDVIQRRGRAGRTQEGHYYALYSQQRCQRMENAGLPDMLKLDLTSVCLSVKALGFAGNIGDFLAASITPPSPSAVKEAVDSLKAMDALAENERITSLGRLLCHIPLDPSRGKMILLGMLFRCLGPMIVMSALPERTSLFDLPPVGRVAAKQAQKHFVVADSDHLTQLNVYNQLQKQERSDPRTGSSFAYKNYLNFRKYKELKLIAEQIEDVLVGHRLVPRRDEDERRFSSVGGIQLNVNSGNEQLLKALLVKGLYPNVAITTAKRRKYMALKAAATGNHNVYLQNSSVIFGDHEKFEKYSAFMYNGLISQSNKTAAWNVSHIESPLVLALFGGPLLRPEPDDAVVQQHPLRTPDGDKFGFAYMVGHPDHNNPQSRTPAETLVQFREHMDAVLNDAFRRLLFQQSGKSAKAGAQWVDTPELKDVVDRVVVLLTCERTRLALQERL
ncbi:hypothetical protein PpBr36_04155 [Pyricularia pennisetigena]|uniref:hypothetical protein n=1 Tax=Pyricularia pennisetigena TaxID=1578925 RepID=UPI001151FA7D|nr:hypothetical protein PpBr36_04155 [Pyricularia pennisetigena]TLS26582.1 hypothetical protein PpBr36_04155 [Pyricularia pennisetigena]